MKKTKKIRGRTIVQAFSLLSLLRSSAFSSLLAARPLPSFLFLSFCDGRLRQRADRALRRCPPGTRRCRRQDGGGGERSVVGIVVGLSAARRGAGGHLRRWLQGEEEDCVDVACVTASAGGLNQQETRRRKTESDGGGKEVADGDGIERFFRLLLPFRSPSSAPLPLQTRQPSTSVADYMNLPSPVRYEELQREVMSESE